MERYDTETAEINPRFQYPIAKSPELNELRKLSGVEANPDVGELENVKNIVGYVHRLFAHDGDNTPSSADPLTILKEAQASQSFRCVEYSALAAGLLWANKIPARTVGLKTSDVETRKYGAGHVVIEFWSNGLNKWVMCDVQAGVIPKHDSTPLSALELAQQLQYHGSVSYEPVTGSRFVQEDSYGDKKDYSAWIGEYLYFLDTPLNLTLETEDKRKQQIVMLVPVGTKPPKSFQGMFYMNALYTHSVQDFYPNLSNTSSDILPL